MDDDAALARRLQQMEAQAAAPHAFNLEGTIKIVLNAEDPILQALAISLMPLEEMEAAAAESAQLQQVLSADDDHQTAVPLLQAQDYLVQQLLTWFKQHFFSWVDSPKCSFCSSSQMAFTGQVPPNTEEAAHDCSRTELHSCALCATTTRFPRYNSVKKLLETRCGRCGEWANAFLLCCRAAGIDARYVRDWSDHVWTEYYSAALGRWVHLDACEAAFDKPLLYEVGWGKKLNYVVAVGRDGAMDVTKRYTRSWPELLSRRTLVPEAWLAQQVAGISQALRAGRPSAEVAALAARDVAERCQLESGAAAASGDGADLPGRQSGSEAWRSERHETGGSGGVATAAPAVGKPPTDYCKAADERLPDIFARWGRVTGGVCRASGHHPPAELAACAFDGSSCSKWLDFGGAGQGGSAWVEYRLLPSQPPVVLASYDMLSADDCPERDPCDWLLECMPEPAAAAAAGSSATSALPRKLPADSTTATPAAPATSTKQQQWVVLDKRQGQLFSERHQLKSFPVASPTSPVASRRFRLTITRARDPAAATCMQLACLNLYTAAEPPAAEAAAQLRQEGSLDKKHLDMLVKILSNVQQHPGEAKYRRIRQCKISALTQHAAAAQLLRAVGFRPLLCAAAGGHQQQEEEVVLLSDIRREWDEAATAAVEVLQQR